MIEKNYLLRYLSYAFEINFKQSTQDYRSFTKNTIKRADESFNFIKNEQNINIKNFDNILLKPKKITTFEEFLESSSTSAFILIKDDKIYYENYFNGYNQDSYFQIFSVTKTFVSALVGIAISEGRINNINEPVTKYLPELLSKGFNKLTINDLLQMHSGVKFNEGHSIFNDEPKAYLSPDWRELINTIYIKDEIGKFFHYSDYYLVLLANILERVLDCSITEYLGKNIWQKIGPSSDAFICLDSSKSKLEKIESGLVCKPIDLMKFGKLYLNNGSFNGQQVVPDEWIKSSLSFNTNNHTKDYFKYYNGKTWGRWFSSGNGEYRNYWWAYKVGENDYDYFGLGILGQILYVSPRNNAIGLRLGDEWGIRGWWPTVIKNLIDKL